MTATCRSRGTKWRLLAATRPSSSGSASAPVRSATSVVRTVAGKRAPDRLLVRPERAPVPIDRHDPPARTEQVRQGERERPLPRPDVGPRPARTGSLDRRPQQRDVIARDPR